MQVVIKSYGQSTKNSFWLFWISFLRSWVELGDIDPPPPTFGFSLNLTVTLQDKGYLSPFSRWGDWDSNRNYTSEQKSEPGFKGFQHYTFQCLVSHVFLLQFKLDSFCFFFLKYKHTIYMSPDTSVSFIILPLGNLTAPLQRISLISAP